MITGMLDFIKNEINLPEAFLREHKDTNKVFLYGAGEAVVWYIEFLSHNSISVDNIIVSDLSNQPSKKYGIPLIGIDEIRRTTDNYEIIIAAPKYKEEIIESIKDIVDINKVYSFETEIYCTFVHNINQLREYYINNFKRLEDMYWGVADEISRNTLEAFIKGRISGNQDYYKAVRVDNPYYSSDIISLSEDEVLVELGSNNGDTLLDFLNKVERKYKKCICFEPDEQCIKQLKDIIKNESGNIELIELGAYDKKDILKFAVNDNDEKHATAHISDKGGELSVEVDSVDNCIHEKITFLKMDIEGSELKALQGSKMTIQKYMPKLAVSVYHNNEDLLEIYEFIKSLPIDYNIYLRHYNHSATDTILYAVL